jgi:hypothetical protein
MGAPGEQDNLVAAAALAGAQHAGQIVGQTSLAWRAFGRQAGRLRSFGRPRGRDEPQPCWAAHNFVSPRSAPADERIGPGQTMRAY